MKFFLEVELNIAYTWDKNLTTFTSSLEEVYMLRREKSNSGKADRAWSGKYELNMSRTSIHDYSMYLRFKFVSQPASSSCCSS